MERHFELHQTKLQSALLIRDQVVCGLESYLREKGFISAPPPCILPNINPSDFQFDFYGDDATLSQSGALYLVALAMSLGKVYSLHPVFRSEKPGAEHHLAEFWMLELEALSMNMGELMELIERLIKYVIRRVLSKCFHELRLLGQDVAFLYNICEEKFPHVEYVDVINRLHSEGQEIRWGNDLDDFEQLIGEWYDMPIFIVNYPYFCVTWSAQPVGKDSLSFNLIAPKGYGEMVEGCQRCFDAHFLEKKFQKAGVNLHWYADIHKHKAIPHSGSGLGIERLCQWLCGLDNIRDTIPFPRSWKDFYP